MVDALLGTIGVAAAAGFSSWAVVLMQRKSSNGGNFPWMNILRKSRAPEMLPVPVQVKPEWATPTTDDIFSIRKEMVAVRELAAEMARDVHEPAWPADLQRSIADLAERLDGFLFRTATSEQRLEALEASRLAAPPTPDLSPVLLGISEQLEALAKSMAEPDPRPELMSKLTRGLVALPEQLTRQIGELLAAERSRTLKSAPQGNAVSQSRGPSSEANSPPPPPRRPPPTIVPFAAPTNPVSPSVPAPYVAGSVFIPANAVTNLLALIQTTLSPNCPGSATEFSLEADDAVATTIYVGAYSSLGGALSATNYGYRLKNGDPPRIYRAAYPGGNTAIGEVQVFATAGEWLHVEVQS